MRLIKMFVLAFSFMALMVAGAGCGKDAGTDLTTAETLDQESMVETYVEAYEKLDFKKMWKTWPPEVFGGKVNVIAEMKKEIFRNYYSDKARLSVEYGDILEGTDEDQEDVEKYLSETGIKYVTDLYRTDYKATVTGGKRDGETYKEGVIYVFRYGGKWFVYDN